MLKLATDTYMRFPFLRERVKNLRRGQLKAVKQTLRRGGLMPDSSNIDYSKSLIVPTNFGLRMWINSQDRFPQGIVPVQDKDRLIEEVREFLKSDRDPINGRPIIAEVYRGDELYQGDFVSHAPDLVIEYANFYDPDAAPVAANPHLEGGHTLDGIFLSSGPNIRSGKTEDASLMDLSPTILHIFGLEIPPDMDGHVLEEIFTDEYRRGHPIRRGTIPARYDSIEAVPGLTSDEEREVYEQLRRLGYV
jgi:predicted AlkP superfamily phosphohydrolase/phosphomutase